MLVRCYYAYLCRSSTRQSAMCISRHVETVMKFELPVGYFKGFLCSSRRVSPFAQFLILSDKYALWQESAPLSKSSLIGLS